MCGLGRSEELVLELEKLVLEVAHDKKSPCWCQVAIGNPMMKDHSQQCKALREYFNEKDSYCE